MRSAPLALLVIVLSLLAGCVPTLNPVYTQKDLVYDAALVGNWSAPNAVETWSFEYVGNQQYRLTYTNKEGERGLFAAHLAEVNGIRFLDLFPEDTDNGKVAFHKFHLVPIHTVYRLKTTAEGLRLAGIDYTWLDNHLKNHPESIQHTTFQGRRLITASTEELQVFLVEHQGRFTADFRLERVAEAD